MSEPKTTETTYRPAKAIQLHGQKLTLGDASKVLGGMGYENLSNIENLRAWMERFQMTHIIFDQDGESYELTCHGQFTIYW